MLTKRVFLALASLLLCSGVSRAELISLEIQRREPFAGDKSFGEVGQYEKIVGIAKFALDPEAVRNEDIVDLWLAPRNARGKVEFATDFYILAPKDPAKGNGAIFYDVNNRGNKLALRFFNLAPGGNDLDKPGSEGDGFLMRRGYTVVWCGWIGELLPGNKRLLLQAPIATYFGKPIRGKVRFEMCSDDPADSMPLSRREGHGSYSPTKDGEANGILTMRPREDAPREVVPRDKWSLQRLAIPPVKQSVPGTLGQIRLKLTDGVKPGYLYELICECEGPIVQGLGFAAVRDLISFLRYNNTSTNPLLTKDRVSAISRTYAFGVSQSGRFLRTLLHQGFNMDESGRRVFDGLIPHVAGGGLGFFNHRFAQPTRHNGQHEEHAYPADMFPFTYGPSVDPYFERKDRILDPADYGDEFPKVMHTQSAAEYWHRAGSLVHTDPLGKEDAVVPKNVRVYAFGGTQHGPASDPPPRGIAQNLTNPGDYRPFLRALLDALDDWVQLKHEPPPSVYPRIKDGTLVHWDQKSTGFPAIPGVRYPEVIQQPFAGDWGPNFSKLGRIAIEPPKVLGKYTVLVSRSGADGNDLATLLPPEVRVPLATYTGWNLRRKDVGAENMLASLLGSYIPFPRTKAEREKSGDPRQSIQERYGSFEKYLARFEDGCHALVKGRYLLREDAAQLVGARHKLRGLFIESE